ncbi:hypothetical protein RM533_05115 [Croceicoccus sp. F390]|uniref:Uncharacterized protein n=1 Tax=Croceicoccus esteveae TaxID=3075597 RepID=A0ABU2ZG33_9SPHN|nr:hypothetical protein [Croceicoccus sp. F390]MDT0575558.1 hypothetical protein [Croceicoccus sp. F390]
MTKQTSANANSTPPDRIDPGAPPETPASPPPIEEPMRQPGEFDPPAPDTTVPGGTPMETPPPPD